MSKIYFITGAGASGKSTIIEPLQKELGDLFEVIDFDSIGVPSDADTGWRQETTEAWIKKRLASHKDTVLVGQMVLGEILACPSAKGLKEIYLCHLEASVEERKKRLKKRGDSSPYTDMINWAEWLRDHLKNPQHKQHVIKDHAWKEMNFSIWDQHDAWPAHVVVEYYYTTNRTVSETSCFIATRITLMSGKRMSDALEAIKNKFEVLHKDFLSLKVLYNAVIPDTAYKFSSNLFHIYCQTTQLLLFGKMIRIIKDTKNQYNTLSYTILVDEMLEDPHFKGSETLKAIQRCIRSFFKKDCKYVEFADKHFAHLELNDNNTRKELKGYEISDKAITNTIHFIEKIHGRIDEMLNSGSSNYMENDCNAFNEALWDGYKKAGFVKKHDSKTK